jgi:phospholipase C
MGYYDRGDLPVHYALADGFALCQRWFSSVMGPTWPNRVYAHAAQSQGVNENSFPDWSLGFTCQTIWELLDAAGISWAYYYSDLPFIALFPALLGRPEIRPLARYFEDLDAGTLPQVVMIEPAFSSNDDHPPHDIRLGQLFISTVFTALAQSSRWSRSLFVLTYDEHGGFFDHVPPPTVPDDYAAEGFDQLGFRVPTLVAGPWVREGHVSSVQYDHTSWLRQVQVLFGLPALTARDAAAADFTDLLDADRIARGDARTPPTLPEIDASWGDPDCEPLGSAQAELAALADHGRIPPELDRRHLVRETMTDLARHARRLRTGTLTIR